ncbi:MAG: PIN domain-containing protein [Chloroflexi bacterium]|nr:PIN domain-containing protein [Chloroflexota bacterium]
MAASLERLSSLLLARLDVPLARQAAAVAAQHRLRSSDAVHAAVALQFGSTLVTRDREQHDRVAALVPTRTPAEALAGGQAQARAFAALRPRWVREART